ncbi:MAG TPA: cell division protein FtsZ [bacterium]|nr:cell division protein FtsZ [bacterium]
MNLKTKTKEIKPEVETFVQIKVVGVGGSGGAVINRMQADRIKGVDFIAVNTDAQALHNNLANTKIYIGKEVTKGLGAGMNPEIGREAAEESVDEIREALKGSDLVFITCGFGGGTGSGASPIVAQVAHEVGALVIGVVTKPFSFEGAQRKMIAERGLDELSQRVDTIITIANDRILQIIDKKTSLLEAFGIVDDVLRQGVKGIAELITSSGEINVDFADVKAVMSDAGSALMGIGVATGENRAVEAAKAAIDSPLLELSIDGARGILFTITGSKNLGMNEVNEAARIITSSADPNAKIIFGVVIDDNIREELKVTVIATGFGNNSKVTESKYQPPSGVLDFTPPVAPPSYKKDHIPQRIERETVPTGLDKATFIKKAADSPDDNQDDELEIPAFIRRKMM